MKLRQRAIVAMLGTALSGCAGQALLERPITQMSNDELLSHYYSLEREARNNDDLVRAIQNNPRSGQRGEAFTSFAMQTVVSAQTGAMRQRQIDTREEMDRRSLSPEAEAPIGGNGYGVRPVYAPESVRMATLTEEDRETFTVIAYVGAPELTRKTSRYQFTAEQYAKGMGCPYVIAVMNYFAPTVENFTVTCGESEPLSVRCKDGVCRELLATP